MTLSIRDIGFVKNDTQAVPWIKQHLSKTAPFATKKKVTFSKIISDKSVK
jgi:hypothetical protein